MTRPTQQHLELVERYATEVADAAKSVRMLGLRDDEPVPLALWLYFDRDGVCGFGARVTHDTTCSRIRSNTIAWQHTGHQRHLLAVDIRSARPAIRSSVNVYRRSTIAPTWRFSHSS